MADEDVNDDVDDDDCDEVVVLPLPLVLPLALGLALALVDEAFLLLIDESHGDTWMSTSHIVAWNGPFHGYPCDEGRWNLSQWLVVEVWKYVEGWKYEVHKGRVE